MKKKHFFGMLSICASAAMVVSCSSDDFSLSSSTGAIKPVIGLDSKVFKPAADSRAGSTVSVDDLSLRLISADGSVNKQWDRIGDFDTNAEFRVGTYTMEAFYGDENSEGFEMPYFHGNATFEIEENRTTPVSITAKLANSMVTVVYTDAFRDYFSSYTVQIHPEGGSYIEYTGDETRPVYIRSGKVTILADIVKQNGVAATLEAASFTAKPQYHYTVTVDVNGGNAGSASLIISFDDNVVEQDVEIDLSDDLLNSPAPTITCKGVESGTTYNFVSGMSSPVAPQFNIIAHGGISAVTLTANSKSLNEQGWPEEVDLCNATQQQRDVMQSLGLNVRGLYGVVDKMAVVDMSAVIEHIAYRAHGDNNSTFAIVVKDKVGKVTEPITFTVEVEPVELEITSVEAIYAGDTQARLTFNYNGEDAANRVKVQYLSKYGVFDPVESAVITPLGRSGATYQAVVTIPDDIDPVVFKLVCDDVSATSSEEINVGRVESDYELQASDNDAFSTYASLIVVDKGGNLTTLPSDAKIELAKVDGSTMTTHAHSVSGNYVKLTGLTPATEYKARIVNGEVPSRIVTFTTEPATPLENGTFDDNTWTITKENKHNNHRYAVTGWSTLNEKTTSQDGAGYGYITTSGTKPDGGAALIRTVGWGSGNTASANAFNKKSFGTCKHLTPGQLYLGTFNGVGATPEVTYGIEHTARPSSLTFKYKYATAYDNDNGDYGTAEITVYDAAGNVIDSKSRQLPRTGNYTDMTLDLSYPVNAAKAAKISVVFKSSEWAEDDSSKLNATYVKPPKPLDLGAEEYVGSQLWIDDVELHY